MPKEPTDKTVIGAWIFAAIIVIVAIFVFANKFESQPPIGSEKREPKEGVPMEQKP